MNIFQRIGSGLGLTASQEERDAAARMKGAGEEQRVRTGRLDTQVGQSRGQYLDRLSGFDPQEYMKEAAGAMMSEASEGYQRATNARGRSLNSRGLFRSTIGKGRQDQDFAERLARAMSGLSMQTAQMEQGRIDRFGDLHSEDRGYAENSRETYLDLLGGDRDYEMGRRRDRLGTTLGVARTAAAFVPGAGAPAGR